MKEIIASYVGGSYYGDMMWAVNDLRVKKTNTLREYFDNREEARKSKSAASSFSRAATLIC